MKTCLNITLITLFIFTLSLRAQAQSQPITLRHANVPVDSFLGQTLAEGGKSYADVQLEYFYQTSRDVLSGLETKKHLERLSLEGQKSKVFTKCEQITAKRYDHAWDNSERDLISWCLEVIAKSVSIPSQYESLSQEARIFKRRVKPTDIEKIELTDSISKNAEYILINGHPVGFQNGTIKVPKRGFHLTVISSAHQALIEYTDAAEMKHLELNKSGLVFGDCDSGLTLLPSPLIGASDKQSLLAISKGCAQYIRQEPKTGQVELAKSSSKSQSDKKISKTGSIFDSKWLWIGLGSVLAYQVLTRDSGDGATPPPSTKRGF